MKFNYKFSNLLGTVYKSGDLLFTQDGNTLLCPVGNKISMYDLANNRAITLPIEARYNYSSLALSPNGAILIAAQEDGEIHVINLGFKNVIYRKRLYGKVRNIKFSPCGKYFALSKGKTVFVYSSPSCTRRVYDPFSMEKVYDISYDKIRCIDWSYDSRVLCFGSADMAIHVVAFTKFENFRNVEVGGNTDSITGTYFREQSYDLCTISKNGHLNVYSCSATKADDLIVAMNKYNPVINEEEEDDIIKNSVDEEEKKKEPKNNRAVYYKRKSRMYLTQFLKGQTGVATSSCYNKKNSVMVVGFSTGDFLILDLTGEEGTLIHSLNVSQESISRTCMNPSGDWIALGVAATGEVIVWEWQSETHVLKQQGHFNSMKVVCFSPDCQNVATGGDDGKVKIWSTQTSFCFVTFSEHTSDVTGIVFTQSGKAVLSSSLDGTVRAFDMIRYRNFKTLTSPQPTQFSCLTVDSSGDLVAAGGQDNHNIYLWSLKTGSMLEILGGHTGPVVSIQFSYQLGSTKLISTSWDKSVKVWDAIANTTAKETVALIADGTCVAFRIDGKQFAVATMNGHITVFNADTLRQDHIIEGKNDLGAGVEDTDKVSAKTNLEANFFTSISYSPDGSFIIAGGKSKYVCIYSVRDELLIKKFEITQNRSLDGMDKRIRRRKIAENDINLSLVQMRNNRDKGKIPGAAKGSFAERSFRPQVMVTGLVFSSTGRSWAACSTEGLLAYSLDDDWLFDPIHLETTNTPETVRQKLKEKSYSMALMMACKLNISSLIMEVIESIPPDAISLVVDSLSQIYVESLVKFFPEMLETSRHVGFYALWVSLLVTKHGQMLKKKAPLIMADLCALQKSLTTHYDNLSKVCSHNEYMLSYLLSQASLKQRRALKTEDDCEPMVEASSSEDEELSDKSLSDEEIS